MIGTRSNYNQMSQSMSYGIIQPSFEVASWKVDPELVVYWLNNLIHPLGDGEETFNDKAYHDKLHAFSCSI